MEQLLIVSLIVFVAGLIKGFSGFGYAVAGVGLLSLFMPPADAVVLMIVPLLAANLELVREIDIDRLRNCISSFRYLIAGIVTGTLFGMAFIGRVPGGLLANFIGIFLIIYVASRTGVFEGHFDRVRSICFRKNSAFQLLSGVVGGFVFGSASIGALIVSYLDSVDMDRELFVGLLAFTLLIVSALRTVFSWQMGYYSGNDLLQLSLIASIPGVLGVSIGSWLGSSVSEEIVQKSTMALLLAIALRLLTG